MEYNETFNVVLTENSNRIQIDASRNITQVTIIEDNDCKCMSCYSGLFEGNASTVRIILAIPLVNRYSNGLCIASFLVPLLTFLFYRLIFR